MPTIFGLIGKKGRRSLTVPIGLGVGWFRSYVVPSRLPRLPTYAALKSVRQGATSCSTVRLYCCAYALRKFGATPMTPPEGFLAASKLTVGGSGKPSLTRVPTKLSPGTTLYIGPKGRCRKSCKRAPPLPFGL